MQQPAATVAPLLEAVRDPSPDVARRALGWLAQSAGAAELAQLRDLLWCCDLAVVGDVAHTLRTLGDRGTVEEAGARLRVGTPPERCRAAIVLARLRDERARPELCAALEDADAAVRGAALDALARLGHDADAANATVPLLRDPDPDVRRRAVRAIARLASHLPDKVRDAVTDPDASVRREAARLAARLPEPDMWSLAQDRDAEIRRTAAESAGRGEEAVLAHLLAEDRHPGVRLAAAQTLGRLGGARAAAILICAAVDDDSAIVRAAALHGARTAVAPMSLRDTLHALLTGGSGRRRCMALQALAALPDRLGPERLIGLARDPDPEVRLALAHTALDLLEKPQQVLDVLRGDDDATVAHAAAVQTRRLGS